MFTCVDVARAAQLETGAKSGDEQKFACPRHEDRHPSLAINQTKDCWLCGPCGHSGNAWALAAFVAKAEPEDKPAVVRWLKAHGLMNGNGDHTATPPNRWKNHPIKE